MKTSKGFSTVKIIIVLILIALIAAAIFVGYWLYNENVNLSAEIEDSRVTVEKYLSVKEQMDNEVSRCEELISSGTSVFGDFAYCERFLEWVPTLD
ncbi:MAG: hypothetical protein ABH846_00045 [Patescibacteria group bacterium]